MLYAFNALMLLLFDRPQQRRPCDVVSVIAFNQRKQTRRTGQSIPRRSWKNMEDLVQGGPLPVIKLVTTPINGRQ